MGLRAPKIAGFSPPDANGGGIELRFWHAVDFPDDLFDVTPAFSQLTDHGSLGGNLVQGTASQRPLRTTFRGRLAAQYDSANDALISDIASSNYRFLHDGTGTTLFVNLQINPSNRTVLDTLGNNANNTGVDIVRVGTNTLRFRVGNSSGTFVINVTPPNGSFPAFDGRSRTFLVRWDTSGYDIRIDGASVSSGAIVGVPDVGDPQGTFHLGVRVTGGAVLDGRMREVGAYAGLLTDEATERLEKYLSRWSS